MYYWFIPHVWCVTIVVKVELLHFAQFPFFFEWRSFCIYNSSQKRTVFRVIIFFFYFVILRFDYIFMLVNQNRCTRTVWFNEFFFFFDHIVHESLKFLKNCMKFYSFFKILMLLFSSVRAQNMYFILSNDI